jgi:hypothetical protein
MHPDERNQQPASLSLRLAFCLKSAGESRASKIIDQLLAIDDNVRIPAGICDGRATARSLS